MTLSLLPTILVPLVGIMFPLIAISSLFIYIETENKEIFDSADYKSLFVIKKILNLNKIHK
jgi:photosystem I reaction center subunit VIII